MLGHKKEVAVSPWGIQGTLHRVADPWIKSWKIEDQIDQWGESVPWRRNDWRDTDSWSAQHVLATASHSVGLWYKV